MVIRNLNSVRAVIGPYKKNPILIIDPYAVLSLSVLFQCFQSIPRRDPEGNKADYGVQLIQFPPGHSPDLHGAGSPGFL